MKIKNIYNELITAYLKEKNRCVGRYEDKLVVSPDTYVAYLIPEKEFPFDIEKIVGKEIDCKPHLNYLSESEWAYMTGECRIIHRGSKNAKPITVAQIANDKDKSWVDVELLKNFNNPRYSISGIRYAPIFIYEDDDLAGFVFPVNVKEGE